MGPRAARLPGGERLHLQHGPIDLIIGADGTDGAREAAFAAAERRFATLLDELVAELPLLRAPLRPGAPAPAGAVARRMIAAASPFAADLFVTPMIAVAGAVADEILAAMVAAADLRRAYVNNGGDIALHLGPGASFALAIADHEGRDLGRARVFAGDPVRGVATSGRHGRSLSLGLADSVTALAASAASADAAATLIANAVDLPGHPAVTRRPAREVRDESDLGERLVVTACGPLGAAEVEAALSRGRARGEGFAQRGLIAAASLHLQGAAAATASPHFQSPERTLAHA